MDYEARRKLVAWVAERVMPHERKVRAWLARSRMSKEDIDDAIQEAYCRLSALDGFEAIDRPDGYFFSIARNLVAAQMRRARIVTIESVAEIEALSPFDEAPSQERNALARIELARIQEIVTTLPDRCRQIFHMRKIEGLPQREIAERLGVKLSVVENDAAKAVRLIVEALRTQEEANIASIESGRAISGGAP
jgi:RNA polymerase sigma-70 factor (ECF subfamily)